MLTLQNMFDIGFSLRELNDVGVWHVSRPIYPRLNDRPYNLLLKPQNHIILY